jgi:hypothetical protein
MTNLTMPQAPPALERGTLVTPVDALLGVWAPHGGLVPPEGLGPGVIEKIAPDGRVRVHWLEAEVDAWMEAEDLRSLGANTHVISVYRCDGQGHNTRLRHRLVDGGIGCSANWTVELRPDAIIRVVRADGAAWTFRQHTHPGLERVVTRWPDQPPEDDDAEAFTVAELALA